MSQFSELVSKAARDMGGYAPNSSDGPLAAGSCLIKLDSNENPFGPSPLATEAMQAALASAHTYPDDECKELRARLAAQHGLQVEQVLVTPGSTGMLSLLCQTLLAPGLNAVTSACSFIVYSMVVRATGARLIEAPLRDDGLDLHAFLKAIDADTRLVFLANPNNPTGTVVPVTQIDKFLAAVPRQVVVALDEAYHEFASDFATARGVEYSRSLDYVRREANLVVLRTFSKVHGLAGLRIGYGLGPAELMGYCARMANTYSVSSVAQTAALAALEDQDHIQRAVSNNTEQAEALQKGLAGLGFRVVPTWANFVYCDVGEDASGFAARLREEGVIVRPLGAWGAPNRVRVSIGTREQNRVLLEAAGRVA
jgi:histidinol-phosphate aminotransferase